MNTVLRDEQTERNILETSSTIGAPETAVSLAPSEYASAPPNHQQTLLEDLKRLHRSLRGPEELLDRGNYGRPFPPKKGYSSISTNKG